MSLDFSLSIFEDQLFQNLNGTVQDWRNKEFTNCRFLKCDLSASVFINSVFTNCKFTECNLSNVKVDGASFNDVLLENSKLLGINFTKINTLLINWSFKNCLISLCDFSNLEIKNTKFLDCEIKENVFIKCDLSGCEFKNSGLSGSRFQNCNLEKADFRSAKNYYLDPTINKLKGARFSYPEVLSLLEGFGVKVE